MFEGFLTYWRRRIAEATLGGIEDAARALDKAAIENKREVSDGVVLLLEEKPARKGK